MQSSDLRSPDSARSSLRAVVAKLDSKMSHLSAQASIEDNKTSIGELQASWGELVSLLALGPEPDYRECPTCKHIGMRAATICGYCWTKLTPLSAA
jgi:hypothetical protein